jgi:hypothetical protein
MCWERWRSPKLFGKRKIDGQNAKGLAKGQSLSHQRCYLEVKVGMSAIGETHSHVTLGAVISSVHLL